MITKKNLIELLKASIRREEGENKLYEFRDKYLLKLRNLLTKYILLGGTFPSKYNLNTNLFAKPTDKKFLNNKNLYKQSPVDMMGHNVISLLYDIYKGKVKLKPIKYFKGKELELLHYLITKFVEIDLEYRDSERKVKELAQKFARNTPFYKINYKIYKAILNILEPSNINQKLKEKK